MHLDSTDGHGRVAAFALLAALTLGLPTDARASAYSDAVAAHFIECLEAEAGSVNDADRELLASFAPELAALLDAGDESVDCAAGSPGEADCVAAIEQTPCDGLATDLSGVLGVTISDVPTLDWAETYATAVSAKILECHALELGEAPTSADVEVLDGYRAQIAQTMSAIVLEGACEAAESELPSCTDAIRSSSCEAILASMASTLGMPQTTAGAPPPTEAEIEAMLDQEVPELSDAELDAMIDEAAANMSSPFPLFEGACARLLRCEYASALGDDS